MFTGLIEEIGKVVSVRQDSLEIECKRIQSDLSIGDSIAVNGVCLTVVSFSSHRFKAEVMPVTLRATNLGGLMPGIPVNLERAMALDKRLGGHLVAGHIDATAPILDKREEGDALLVSVGIPTGLDAFIIHKGSIALDGISLTVAHIDDRQMTVSLVGHTRNSTALAQKGIGDAVNVECDQIGKYIQKMVSIQYGGNASHGTRHRSEKLSMDYLMEQGF
ncbi:MAG: riboflavin synthase [Sphaerochaeta sp.]|nr:riboflavin synthase [Sphaerochaeta sp.]